MSDRSWVEPLVERVVGEVLDSHAAQVRSEIVRRVMEEAAAEPSNSVAPSTSASADLARAILDIQSGTSQKEILRALLESSSCCAARVALFVVKGNRAMGWQARGFLNGEAIKDFALDPAAPAVSKAISDRIATSAAGTEFDPAFLNQFGNPAGEARLLPLILKDKVAALIYADGGTDGVMFDAGSLEVLVLSTSAWLEINALRKQAHKDAASAPADTNNAPVNEAVAAPVPAFNDPFAAHSPAYAMAAAASAGASEAVETSAPSLDNTVVAESHSAAVEVQSAAATAPEVVAEPFLIGQATTVVEAATTTDAAPAISPADQEIHSKAQRFARLLVDEIKLYNQAQVAEGRKNKDLYDRLKDTIDKSRITYQKRYGNTVAASGNYFQHELIRSLAEDNVSLMGLNFSL
jgi:hypothetical protein